MSLTTDAIGEEDPKTTSLWGEEGGGETTHAEGEEDPNTTIAVGEEDETSSSTENPFGSF